MIKYKCEQKEEIKKGKENAQEKDSGNICQSINRT